MGHCRTEGALRLHRGRSAHGRRSGRRGGATVEPEAARPAIAVDDAPVARRGPRGPRSPSTTRRSPAEDRAAACNRRDDAPVAAEDRARRPGGARAPRRAHAHRPAAGRSTAADIASPRRLHAAVHRRELRRPQKCSVPGNPRPEAVSEGSIERRVPPAIAPAAMAAVLVRGCVRASAAAPCGAPVRRRRRSAMSSSKLALSFRLFQNGQLIREETLTQSVIKVGKVPSAHLQIADDGVSRMHAIVEVTGRDVSLIDLGSTRGSFVNGKKVNKARLESGDVITLGDTRVELTIRDSAATAAARPPAVPGGVRRSAEPPAVVSGVIGGVVSGVIGGVVSGVIGEGIDAAPAVAPAPALPPTAVTAAGSTAAPPASGASGLAAAPPPAPAIAATVGATAESLAGVALPVALPADPRAQLAEAAGDPGAAAAIEVAAMLGDSVVGVKHCIDPRGGKIAPATWGLVAGGAVCLLASAIAFCASVKTAADNHDRLDAWTRIAHRPAYAFRPARLGPAVDWVAFGGFGLAIVGLGLGIARMRRERVSPYYRIGTAPGVELAIEGAPAPAFPLIAPSGDDFVFQFAPGIDGELLQGGRAISLPELVAAGRARPSASTPGAFALAIPRHARIRARAGRATFQIAAVSRPRRHATPLLA